MRSGRRADLARGSRACSSEPHDLEARTELLRARRTRARRSAGSGLALGHAMAQALGGRYGLPHGAMNALCLPPALRFNEPVAAGAIARFGGGDGRPTPPTRRTVELARLAGFERLRDFGVPREDALPSVGEAAAQRPACARKPASGRAPAEIDGALRSIW